MKKRNLKKRPLPAGVLGFAWRRSGRERATRKRLVQRVQCNGKNCKYTCAGGITVCNTCGASDWD
jgi:hypothetical protein